MADAHFQRARFDADLVFKALKEADFRARLLADPTKVYGEELPGKAIPEGVEIRIADKAENVFYVILPCIPPDMKLSDDALRRVARHEQTYRHPCWASGTRRNSPAAGERIQSPGGAPRTSPISQRAPNWRVAISPVCAP